MIEDKDLMIRDATIPCITNISETTRKYTDMLVGERVRAVIDEGDLYSPTIVFNSGYGMEMIRANTNRSIEEQSYRVRIIPKDVIDTRICERVENLKGKCAEFNRLAEEFEEYQFK